MSIEKEISNKYHIFKLGWDKLNWTYVAEGPLVRSLDVQTPERTNDIKIFTNDLIKDHIEYLRSKNSLPRNHACSYITFSYEPTYDSALMGNEIWHAEKLSDEEKNQFEQCMIDSHKKYMK